MIKLTITTPSAAYHYEIAWLDVETPHGGLTIQPGHEPCIVSLKPQFPIIFRLTTGKQESFPVTRGIMEVTREHVTVLIT